MLQTMINNDAENNMEQNITQITDSTFKMNQLLDDLLNTRMLLCSFCVVRFLITLLPTRARLHIS